MVSVGSMLGVVFAAASIVGSTGDVWGFLFSLAAITSTNLGLGVPLGVSLGLVGAAAAVFGDSDSDSDSDADTDGRELRTMLRYASMALALGLFGLVIGAIFATAVLLLLGSQSVVSLVAATVLNEFGLAIAALWFVTSTDRGLSYFDVRVPDPRELKYAVGGVVAIFGLLVVLSTVSNALGLPSSQNSIVQVASGNPYGLLVLVPLSWLVIGPGEELLYRNVVQKYLYGGFSRTGAVLVACVVFTLMHVPAYYTPNSLAMLDTLVSLFFLSLILGVAYERTNNVVVTILIHGTFDAVQFAALFLTLKP